MEIEVGEYVRTKKGIIAKLECINGGSDYIFDKSIYRKYSDTIEILQEYELEKYIAKHSFDIIDLIEVGDLVQIHDRGNRIYQVDRNYQGKLAIIDVGWNEYETLYNENIKNIVTKEQFESMEYKVGEE